MTEIFRRQFAATLIVAVAVAHALMGPATAQAQQPDPPAANPDDGAAAIEIQPAAPDPTSQRRVNRILGMPRNTPARTLRAVRMLLDVRRPDAAVPLLEELLNQNPDEATLVALVDELGTSLFLRLAREPALEPLGAELANRAIDAARAANTDPANIDTWLAELADPNRHVRARAVDRLRTVRGPALAPLVQLLADDTKTTAHDAAAQALAGIGTDSVAPLAAALTLDDVDFRRRVIIALARISGSESTAYLLAMAHDDDLDASLRSLARRALASRFTTLPDRQQSATFIRDHARHLRALADTPPSDYVEPVEETVAWRWDAATNAPVAELVAADAHALRQVLRFLRLAASVAPPASDLAASLAFDVLRAELRAEALGIGGPSAPESGVTALVAVLRDALDHAPSWTEPHRPNPHDRAVAVTALHRLAAAGAWSTLTSSDATTSLLGRALAHPDPEIRFTALALTLDSGPQAAFPGASLIPLNLIHVAAATGAPRAIVLEQRLSEAQRVAGLLALAGYSATVATDLRDCFHQATASADVALVLISATLNRPTADVAREQFRRDPRTASLPIGFIAAADYFDRAQRFADRDPLADVFVRPHDTATASRQAAMLLALVPDRLAPPEVRRARAAQALAWMAQDNPLLRHHKHRAAYNAAITSALFDEELRAAALTAIAQVPGNRAQKTLVDIASRRTLPLEVRTTALDVFRSHVDRFGVLLLTDEILLQYDRYNASASQPPETIRMLAAILDVIEAPTDYSSTTSSDANEPFPRTLDTPTN